MATALAFSVTAGHAASEKSIEKQAKKVENRLANFPKGAFLHLFFRDGSYSSGKLNKLVQQQLYFHEFRLQLRMQRATRTPMSPGSRRERSTSVKVPDQENTSTSSEPNP